MSSIQNRAGTYVEPSVTGATAALDSFSDAIAKDPRTPIIDPPSSAKEAYPICGVTFVLIPKDGTIELDRQTVKDFVGYASPMDKRQQKVSTMQSSPNCCRTRAKNC